jgi:localization factor PodJL
MIESSLRLQDAPEDKTDAPASPEQPPLPRLNIGPAAPIDPPSVSETPEQAAPTASATSGNPAPATERDRRPIDPNLPPDTPLEPGAIRSRGASSPAERIAASEAALAGVKPPVIADPAGKTNFIAAARRAARAAANDLANRPEPSPPDSPTPNPKGRWNKRMRHLLVGSSVLLVTLGSAHLATHYFTAADTPNADAAAATTPATTQAASIPSSAAPPTQVSTNSRPLLTPAGSAIPFLPASAGVIMPPAPHQNAAAEPTGSADPATTGSIDPLPVPRHRPASSNGAGPTSHRLALPASIGSGLRAAALKGNPAAEYDVAMCYEEGRGVPRDPAAAVEWLQRAAKRGLAPAQFRLGSHYEKGLGVKKDVEAARRLYLAAAKAGNAKAMHNLAVLYAEGAVDGKPDYQTAARWFLKAANHGVADSQYNLGILYARGIGVKADLAQAYKWFALASRDGDKEATKKRDETGSRLEPKELKSARAAAQAWVAEAQPAAAVEVKRPAGGWDNVTASGSTSHHAGSKPIAPPTRIAQ